MDPQHRLYRCRHDRPPPRTGMLRRPRLSCAQTVEPLPRGAEYRYPPGPCAPADWAGRPRLRRSCPLALPSPAGATSSAALTGCHVCQVSHPRRLPAGESVGQQPHGQPPPRHGHPLGLRRHATAWRRSDIQRVIDGAGPAAAANDAAGQDDAPLQPPRIPAASLATRRWRRPTQGDQCTTRPGDCHQHAHEPRR
jgi:hypothetical protein